MKFPKIFIASFNRASDGALSLLSTKMRKRNLLCNSPEEADFILAPGDRTETFDFTLSHFRDNKRIIHLWAGEISQGTHDEVYRHAITLMSEMQLCTNEIARTRTINLCQAVSKTPNCHVVGNVMLDNLKYNMDKVPLHPYDLILYNPPTKLSKKEILQEIQEIKDILPANYIWVAPNGDTGSLLVFPHVTHGNLNRSQFLGLMKHCERFITNSSCMFYEAPFFLKENQIISIGARNKKRESASADMTIPNASDNILQLLKNLTP